MRVVVLLSLLVCCWSMPFDLVPEQLAAIYSDDFARTKVLPLVSATDNDDPSICLNNQFQNAELKRRLSLKCSPYVLDHCTGYSAVLHDEKAIVLSFKGTQGTLQLLLESEETIFANHTAWVAGGTVSKYFNDAFFTLWDGGMKDDFLALKNANKNYQLWIVGHSLGGAMASLAASFITHTKLYAGRQVKLVTFGQPRTGDRDYAASIDNEIAFSFRLIHAHDMVPHLPPNGVELYQHHHTEVYYNNDMSTPTYVICDKDEDINCSDGKLDTSTADHGWYFRDVGLWGSQGCTN